MKHPMLGALGSVSWERRRVPPPSNAAIHCRLHERLSHHAEDLSGERLAALHRVSLRIFDACDAGHLRDVQAKFVELEMRLDAPSKCELTSPSSRQSIELAISGERVQETGVAGYRPLDIQRCAKPERHDE